MSPRGDELVNGISGDNGASNASGASEWSRILLVGAGGQGVLSAGRWLGEAAGACGVPVAVSQLHGLSQRGGSVRASVALGGARSPEIPDGMADLLVALEPMEGVRALSKVSRRTSALVNTRGVLPASLQLAGSPYPDLESLLDPIRDRVGTLVAIDATALAEEAGSARALNAVMLGMVAASGLLPVPGERLLEIILDCGAPDAARVNRAAFRLGEHAMETRFSIKETHDGGTR